MAFAGQGNERVREPATIFQKALTRGEAFLLLLLYSDDDDDGDHE